MTHTPPNLDFIHTRRFELDAEVARLRKIIERERNTLRRLHFEVEAASRRKTEAGQALNDAQRELGRLSVEEQSILVPR